MFEEIKQDANERMTKCVVSLNEHFKRMRTGRANTGLLEGLRVEYYGAEMPLTQVANVTVEDSRTLAITPWDKSMVPVIEKAILKSDLGITPASDGKVIRLAIPPLTEERRKELVKVVRRMAEEGRVAIRNARRDANEAVKKLEKEKKISEDDGRRGTDQVQDLTNRLTKEIDALLAKKEKEIMEF